MGIEAFTKSQKIDLKQGRTALISENLCFIIDETKVKTSDERLFILCIRLN